MKKKKIFSKLVFTFLMLFGLFVFGKAQEVAAEVKDLQQYTEQIYGTDDLLVNGQLYISTRPKAKGSPYYGEEHFVEGSVQIRGKQFKGVLLLYNIEDQRLIIRVAVESGKYITVLLNSNLIDNFIISGHRFVNTDMYTNNAKVRGFFAAVYKGSFDFLIRFEKEFKAVYNNQAPNGSYTKTKSDYFIFDQGKLVNVSTKKALLDYFSPKKKEIKSFMRKHQIKYKKAGVYSLHQLMTYCDSVTTDK